MLLIIFFFVSVIYDFAQQNKYMQKVHLVDLFTQLVTMHGTYNVKKLRKKIRKFL